MPVEQKHEVMLAADSDDFFCERERIAPHSSGLRLGLTALQINQYLHRVTLAAHIRPDVEWRA
jgi:hypothetical protein